MNRRQRTKFIKLIVAGLTVKGYDHPEANELAIHYADEIEMLNYQGYIVDADVEFQAKRHLNLVVEKRH